MNSKKYHSLVLFKYENEFKKENIKAYACLCSSSAIITWVNFGNALLHRRPLTECINSGDISFNKLFKNSTSRLAGKQIIARNSPYKD